MNTSRIAARGGSTRRAAGASVLTIVALVLQVGLASPARAFPGELDHTFGAGGIVRGFSGVAVAFQHDGRIVVAGDQGLRFAVARFNVDGTPDRTFGGDGIVTERFGPGPPGCSGQAWDVKVQSDGGIVASGNSCAGALTIARFDANGTLDRTFGHGGAFFTSGAFAHCDLAGYSVAGALGRRGRVVAGTWGDCRGTRSFVVVRLRHDGSLDLGFSGDGLAAATVQKGIATPIGKGPVAGVAVQPDGRIVIAGSAQYRTHPEGEGDSDFAVFRFDTDGRLDRTFGAGDGTVTTRFPAPRCGGSGEAMGLSLEPDGGIVVGGMAGCTAGPGTESHPRWALVRYRPNGMLDRTFGTGGTAVSIFQTNEGSDAMYGGIALQSDGRIVGAGTLETPSGEGFALARYRANGRIDRTFGTGGTVHIAGDGAWAVGVQPDGRILAAGDGSHEGLLARFLAT